MAIRKVLVIFDEDKFTKEIILDDMKSEGFNHEFKLACDLQMKEYESYIAFSDEVWLFGEVDDLVITAMCKHEGKDIWRMR